jgi:DHA3 family tetracycline resistance protein-like MFS transporter
LLNRRAYRIYLSYEAATAFLFAMVFTFSSVYQVTVAGLTPLQLVLVGTVLEASIFLFEVPTGALADLYGRRLAMVVGCLIVGLGFILEGSIPLFGTILLAQVIWGIGYAFISGSAQAWISDEIGEAQAGPAFLRGTQTDQAGALLGILVSAALANLRVNVPIIVGGALFLVLALVLHWKMPETGFKPPVRRQANPLRSINDTFRSGLKMIRKRPLLVYILGIGLFYGLYSEGFDRLWAKHLLEGIGLPGLGALQPITWFGIISAGGLILSILAAEILRLHVRLSSSWRLARALLIMTGILIFSLFAFALAGSFSMALVALWLVEMARTVISPLYTTWVNQRIDSSVRATVLSMSNQVDAIGQITTGPALGLIGNIFSVRTVLFASALILSPALLLFGRVLSSDVVRDTIPLPPRKGQ